MSNNRLKLIFPALVFPMVLNCTAALAMPLKGVTDIGSALMSENIDKNSANTVLMKYRGRHFSASGPISTSLASFCPQSFRLDYSTNFFGRGAIELFASIPEGQPIPRLYLENQGPIRSALRDRVVPFAVSQVSESEGAATIASKSQSYVESKKMSAGKCDRMVKYAVLNLRGDRAQITELVFFSEAAHCNSPRFNFLNESKGRSCPVYELENL